MFEDRSAEEIDSIICKIVDHGFPEYDGLMMELDNMAIAKRAQERREKKMSYHSRYYCLNETHNLINKAIHELFGQYDLCKKDKKLLNKLIKIADKIKKQIELEDKKLDSYEIV